MLDMYTYTNKDGKPIIRMCLNCKHFETVNIADKTGYCRQLKMMFAYTMNENVYPLVKTFYLCKKHEFKNEQHLSENSQRYDLYQAITEKESKQS